MLSPNLSLISSGGFPSTGNAQMNTEQQEHLKSPLIVYSEFGKVNHQLHYMIKVTM